MNETAKLEVVERTPERSGRQPTLISQVPTTPMEMIGIAVARGATIEEINKLVDLRDRIEATEARKAFDAAVSDAKAEIKPIVKNRVVDFPGKDGRARTHYEYEDLAAVAEAIDPILAKHGLSYRYRSKQDGKLLTITCVLSHRSGHFEETTLSALNDESGNKNAIQSIASAATSLQRYTVKLALGLAASHDDDGRGAEATAKPVIDEKQIADLNALIDEVKADRTKLFKYLKIDRLEQILACNYSAVVKIIERKR